MSPLARLVAPWALLLVIAVHSHARPSSRPVAHQLDSWSTVRGDSICRARVAFDKVLRLHQAWCADDVVDQVFDASGQLFVCRTVRLTVPYQDSDVDVAAGCVAVREGSQSMAIDKRS